MSKLFLKVISQLELLHVIQEGFLFNLSIIKFEVSTIGSVNSFCYFLDRLVLEQNNMFYEESMNMFAVTYTLFFIIHTFEDSYALHSFIHCSCVVFCSLLCIIWQVYAAMLLLCCFFRCCFDL